jgi:hypothetical protein
MKTKEHRNHIIEIAKILKNSKLEKAQYANAAMAPVEFEVEVVAVADKIVKYFSKIKK